MKYPWIGKYKSESIVIYVMFVECAYRGTPRIERGFVIYDSSNTYNAYTSFNEMYFTAI